MVEGDILWIIGKDWMIENGFTFDMNRREVRLHGSSNGGKVERRGERTHENRNEAEEEGERMVGEWMDSG